MKALSSLKLTVYALAGVVLVLVAGMILAQVQPQAQAMKAMNAGLVRDWLLAGPDQEGHNQVAVWFVALCLAVGILVVNLAACAWTRLWPRLKNGARCHDWLLFLAHVLMILILLGHLSQMFMGFKFECLKILAGQERTFPGGLRLKVEKVSYVNDPAQLNLTYRQARRAYTRAAFNRAENQVLVSLWQDESKLREGVLRVLEPLVAGGVRVTLENFYRDDGQRPPQVGALITAAYNPLTSIFFGAYLAWIAVYLALAGRALLRSYNHSQMGE